MTYPWKNKGVCKHCGKPCERFKNGRWRKYCSARCERRECKKRFDKRHGNA